MVEGPTNDPLADSLRRERRRLRGWLLRLLLFAFAGVPERPLLSTPNLRDEESSEFLPACMSSFDFKRVNKL